MADRSDGRRMSDDEYEKRFGGVGRVLGRAAIERIRKARVAVVGLGGVGSWTVEALARTGVGSLTLIDMDDVCVTNMNRHLTALSSTVGRPKAEVLAERVKQIHPLCEVVCELEFLSADNAQRLLAKKFDVVVDAIDRAAIKAHIINWCSQQRVACVTVGAAGGRVDGTRARIVDLGHAENDCLLRQVRKELRSSHGWDRSPDGRRVAMGVEAVTSSESPASSQTDCGVATLGQRSGRIDCEGGLGAVCFVTGVLGMVAAQAVVAALLRG
jgi:tRNA threonylcarbamoyladenosine dehydratase